jgi:hypothetical protein
MKVLVSTETTQGKRDNDFCFVPEGELLNLGGFECDRESIDGACGCRRSFCGLVSNTATTTARVVDVEIDYTTLRSLVEENLREGGWLELDPTASNREWIDRETDDIVKCASQFDAGAVLERRGSTLRLRIAEKE